MNRALYNRLNSAIRRYANHVRRQRWVNVCIEVSHFASSTHIWRVTRALCGGRGPPRHFAGIALVLRETQEETANQFPKVYAPVLPPPHLGPASTTPCVLDDAFTMSELPSGLRQMRRRIAPRPDDIPCRAFLNLPDLALLKHLHVHPGWKEAWIVPIHRPGRSQRTASSYHHVMRGKTNGANGSCSIIVVSGVTPAPTRGYVWVSIKAMHVREHNGSH